MKSMSLQRMASPAAGGGGAQAPVLRRSASAKQASTPSPLGAAPSSHSHSQYLQQPRASTSTPIPASFPRHKPPSINLKAATSTDTPPATPGGTKQPKSASSFYSSIFSPKKLMQRASRAFRSGRSSRRKKSALATAEVESPRSAATSKGSDAETGSVFSLDGQIADDAVHAGAAEVVQEKIIHEANLLSTAVHKLPPVEEEPDEVRDTTPEKEDAAAAEKEKEKEEEPKKEAPPAPVAGVDEIAVAKKQQREEAIKAEVVRRFQGSRVRVRTSMEKWPDDETPRRRDNEAIEEARTKLLALRQGSKVKALVGAFETVMDDTPRGAAASKPKLNLRV